MMPNNDLFIRTFFATIQPRSAGSFVWPTGWHGRALRGLMPAVAAAAAAAIATAGSYDCAAEEGCLHAVWASRRISRPTCCCSSAAAISAERPPSFPFRSLLSWQACGIPFFGRLPGPRFLGGRSRAAARTKVHWMMMTYTLANCQPSCGFRNPSFALFVERARLIPRATVVPAVGRAPRLSCPTGCRTGSVSAATPVSSALGQDFAYC